MQQYAKRRAVYHSQAVQAWEKRWFAAGNSSYGLMQQAALAMTIQIEQALADQQLQDAAILIWCGQGNNGGDGYVLAQYLKQQNIQVAVYAPASPQSPDATLAYQAAIQAGVTIYSDYPQSHYAVHIDALFGIGLNRALNAAAQQQIAKLNAQAGFKIALDIPSGLNPDTGMPSPVAVYADLTLAVMGLKTGMLIGQASLYVGQVVELPLIPIDDELQVCAYWDERQPILPTRQATQHKGSFGHVLVVGGHAEMGGAVMMSAEAAFHTGAGKVSVACHAGHYQAILARSPNVMIKDIDALNQQEIEQLLKSMQAVCFGMGLGRDAWAEYTYQQWFDILNRQMDLAVILDADALWFLAQYPTRLHPQIYATPHPAEAARLLGCAVQEVEQNRIAAIQQLQQQYGGQWVLKGAGSLTLQHGQLDICAFGNAGMATAGMGDVLSGMIAGLKAQFADQVALAEMVALHALAGDRLAQQGIRGIQAHQMPQAIYQVVNG
ncbi:MAG: NAD(P)H-hydrate dehydratase [Acinetobacter sp.]|jgi:hydroxyethylthiazole kinase-like uncharacterized protein yjeF|nr:MAG: NAD(P)H-hydrate dehydratase [Acinetobacter sp.]